MNQPLVKDFQKVGEMVQDDELFDVDKSIENLKRKVMNIPLVKDFQKIGEMVQEDGCSII